LVKKNLKPTLDDFAVVFRVDCSVCGVRREKIVYKSRPQSDTNNYQHPDTFLTTKVEQNPLKTSVARSYVSRAKITILGKF
jgi:hypothetical protein